MTQFVDRMYCQQVQTWTKTKMEAMVAAGYWCGVVAFGYRLETLSVARAGKQPPKRLVPDANQAPMSLAPSSDSSRRAHSPTLPSTSQP